MDGIIGFSAAAIGGLGNVWGAILGGLLFGVLQTLAAAFIPRGSGVPGRGRLRGGHGLQVHGDPGEKTVERV